MEIKKDKLQLAKMFDCSVEWLIGLSDKYSKFSDYNIQPGDVTEIKDTKPEVKAESPLFASFAANFDELSTAQQGILYGKLCEMLHENGKDMK